MSKPLFERPQRLFFTLLSATATAALAALFAAACQPAGPPGKKSEAPAQTTAESLSRARDYQVKGQIRSISADRREVQIHHEAVPGFIGIAGMPEPMDSMTMPFPVADPALLEGLAAGDRIEFTFRVEWDGKLPLSVVEIAKLPADARLAFEKENP